MGSKSQLGWVDFSADDRSRVQHALRQLSEPGTLDELGIGALRDGFADLMFPGFSTVQTRAKYFITVPRILRDYLAMNPAQQRKVSPGDYLREQETKVGNALKLAHPDGRQTGIIGFTMQEGETVVRLPSSVYWVGLRTWGLVNSHASLNQFLQTLTPHDAFSDRFSPDEADDHDAVSNLSRVHIDRYIPDWLDALSITLNKDESVFLSEKFRHGPHDSLPTQFELQNLRSQALSKETFSDLAAWVVSRENLPVQTRDTVRMAQAFSELIYGAHLRFNMALAKINGREDLLKTLSKKWDIWRLETQATPEEIPVWIEKTGINLQQRTTVFLKEWSSGIARRSREDVLENMVITQARDNKKERSILNKRLPVDYGWVGMERLNYRWSQARTILTDIQEGLTC